MTPSEFRERFQASDDRFQAAMLAAIRAHQEGVLIFLEADSQLHARVDDLTESVHELQRLILAQGVEIRALRDERRGNA